MYAKSPSDSVDVTKTSGPGPLSRIVASSIVPEYETNEPVLPPPRPKVTALRASNQEIEDEMKMYSSVQSYEKKKQPMTAAKSTNGNNWLHRTL